MQLADETAVDNAGARSPHADAFEFVKSLAAELTAKEIELPSFPDIAVRVQRVLADDKSTSERIVRVLGSEPALAAKIMTMVNSAAMNPTGRQISDLKTAITRLGFDMLRSAAISFAMAQLRKAQQFKGIEKPLSMQWQRSIVVAALSFVIAKRCTKLPPDTAMLTGLLHGVGRLYILTRASKFPALFGDPASYDVIVRDWHLNIAKALLENWQMSEVVVDAIYDHENLERAVEKPATLGDVLTTATLWASFRDEPEILQAQLREFRAEERLGIDQATFERIQQEANSEIKSLRDALEG